MLPCSHRFTTAAMRCDIDKSVRVLTGIDVVSSLEGPRNAEGAKRRPRPQGKAKKRGQGHYRGRIPEGPRPMILLLPAFARALAVLGVRQHPLTERLPLLVP